MSHWYVIRTHAKGEFKALSNVLRQGFNAYLPQYLKHGATPNGGSEPAPLTMTAR